MSRSHCPSTSDADGEIGTQGRSLLPGTRLECKICWTVYDPAEGDPVWQIPPGTPFADLPGHWRCPTCDGARSQFLPLE